MSLVGYTKYQEVTIDSTKVSADLTDYPIYIDLADFDKATDIFDTATASGGDIRVTKSDGTTELAREVVSFTKDGGTHSLDLESTSSQYAAIADASQTGLDLSTDFTFEAWIKLESLPTTSGLAFAILSKEDTNTTSDRAYHFMIRGDNNKMQVLFTDGTNITIIIVDTAFVSADVGVWKHVAVSVDISVPSATFYIDGVAKTATASSSGATTIVNNAIDFRIGARSTSSGTTNALFDGLVKNVRVFNDIRTASEIDSDAYIENVSDANLQGEWNFNNDYIDSTANGNDLTAYNSPIFSTDLPYKKGGELYVKYTGTLSSSVDTVIRIWYDGSSSDYAVTDTYGRNAVWSDYIGVFHLGDASGNIVNATGNGDLTQNGTPTYGNAGQIGDAIGFDGSTDYFSGTPTGVSSTEPLSLQAIVKKAGTGTYRWGVTVASSSEQIGLLVDSSEYPRAYVYSSTAASAQSSVTVDTTYHLLHAVFASDTSRIIYVDGVNKGSDTTSKAIGAISILNIGIRYSDQWWQGDLDEARLRNSALSADWCATEQNNFMSASTFYSVSTEVVSPTYRNFFSLIEKT